MLKSIAAGGDGCIRQFKFGVPRVIKVNVPPRASGWGITHRDVAGKIDQGTGHAAFPQHRQCSIGADSLANSAEIKF